MQLHAPGARRPVPRGHASTASCSRPLVASALPCRGPGSPVIDVNRPPASSTMGTSAARSAGLHVELAGDVDEALGEQRVRPQVAVGAVAPHPLGEGEQRLEVAGVAPLGDALEAERGVGESSTCGRRMRRRSAARGIRRPARRGPCAAHQRRPIAGRRRDADHGDAVDRERDERRPTPARRAGSSRCRRSGR